MKKMILSVLALSAATVFAQNETPSIDILSTEVDEDLQTVTLNYQLEDADGDPCDVWLKFSADGGTYYEILPETVLSGDVGDGVAASASLSVVWDYSDFEGNPADLRLALFASDNGEVDIADMVAQVDEAELLGLLESVAGERHYIAAPDHLSDVRTLISDAFTDANLQTEGHDFVFGGTDMQNIIGRKPGAKDEAVTFIIDGHFDGVPGSPAADDNGSAVAGVLEAVRILSQYNFEHSIRFIGFDAEELGLVGSSRYVLNGIKPFEEIQGVLNLEMIGYYSEEPDSQMLPPGFGFLFPDAVQEVEADDNRGNFLTVVGNVASNPLINAYLDAATDYVPELRVISVAAPGNAEMAPDLRRSDHSVFWDDGYQALMLTDGADLRNPHYHTPDDVIATLDFEFMANVVKATIAAAAELAVPVSVASDEVDLSTILSAHNHAHDFPAGLTLFPNPSGGVMTVQLSDAEQSFRARLEVFSLSGRLVHKEVLAFPNGTSTTELDLRKLPAGPYILNLHAGGAFTSAGFVIEQ